MSVCTASSSTRRRRLSLFSIILVALIAAGCGDSGDGKPAFITVVPESVVVPISTVVHTDATTTTIKPTLNLDGVCSNPVVVQLDSSLDLFALPYVHLLADSGSGTTTSFRAPLLNPQNGSPTGIDLELRTAGGVSVGGMEKADSVLGDTAVLFTTTNINEVLPVTAGHPVIVAAPWAQTDVALQWDAKIPAMRTIADIAGSVLTNPTLDQAAADYLIGARLLPDPAKAKALRPDIKDVPSGSTASLVHLLDFPQAAQAMTSNEGLGVKAQPLSDVGWEPYPHVVVVSQTSAKERGDCLRAVVPLLQYSILRLSVEPRRSVLKLARIAEQMGLAFDQERLSGQLRGAIDLEMLAVGTPASPIAGDPSLARLLQIARSQKTRSLLRSPSLKLPPDLAKELEPLVNRSFIDSDMKYTIRDKPDFGQADSAP